MVKNASHVKKELNVWLRWINGGGDEAGNSYKTRYYLETVSTGESVEITNVEALKFIGKKTRNGFRTNDFNVYKNYVELLDILNR